MLRKLSISIDIAGLQPLQKMIGQFYRNNRAIEVLRLLHLSSSSMSEIVRVRRSGKLYSTDDIFGRKRELLQKYSLLDFQLIEADMKRGTYTALITHKLPSKLVPVAREVGKSLFITEPIILGMDAISLTVYAVEEKIPALLEKVKRAGAKFDILYSESRIRTGGSSTLLLRDAFEHGYFDVPRRVNTRQLAVMKGISAAAVSKSLRRALRKAVKEYIS